MTAVVERKLAVSVDLVGADLVGRAEVLGDVGPPEPVDRLLRVADDEQPTGHRHELAPVVVLARIVGARGEPHGDLELDRVGVLELVEQDPRVALVEQPADVAALREQPAGEDEQVVELEPARLRPLAAPSSTNLPQIAPSSRRRWRRTPSSSVWSSSTELELGARTASRRPRRPGCFFQFALLPRHRLLAGEGVVGGQDRLERDAHGSSRPRDLGDEHSRRGRPRSS